MFKNWFSSSRGERLQSRSKPANAPKAHTAHHKASHGQRRSTKAIVTHVTTKHPHTSIVVRRDGNIEVMTPRATVVLPESQSNVSRANVVPSLSQYQHRSSTNIPSRSTPNTISSIQNNKPGHRESMQHPKRPQSSRSDRLAHVTTTESRPSTSHRSGSYSAFGRDQDHGISPVQVAIAGKHPRRGSYPVVQLPATYAHGPNPAHPEVIYQPIYSAPPSPAIAVHPAALYSNSTPRPRRSLSNADSVSSYYSDPNIPPHSVPRGWYNRRGDQHLRKGVIIMQPPGRQWHPTFASYPDVGKGWMNEEGKFLPQSGGILKGINKVSVPSDIHIH